MFLKEAKIKLLKCISKNINLYLSEYDFINIVIYLQIITKMISFFFSQHKYISLNSLRYLSCLTFTNEALKFDLLDL